MSEEDIRAKALELAVHAQAARGISDPREIMGLAQYYAAYIRAGAVPEPAYRSPGDIAGSGSALSGAAYANG